MTKNELEILYKNKILPKSKVPYHFAKKENAGTIIEAYNPICGDKYQLYLDIKDHRIVSVYFHGFGCAVSKASSSVLSEKMEGLTLEEAQNLSTTFIESLSNKEPVYFDDEALKILNELKNFEGRVDCIKLSWEAMNKHFKALSWK